MTGVRLKIRNRVRARFRRQVAACVLVATLPGVPLLVAHLELFPVDPPEPGRAGAVDARGFDTSFTKVTWGSNFERGNFSEWDWWGQGDWTYTGLSVIDPADRGLPGLSGRAARFEVTDPDVDAERLNSKLYKFFHTGTGDRVNWGPPDVSGTYRAWYYLPTEYSVRSGGWTTPFQFKDQYWSTERGGSEQSDPVWYLAFENASDHGVPGSRPDAPVAIVRHWEDWTRGYPDSVYPGPRVLVPLGRWFEIRADVYQGDRVEFYMDGKLVNVGRHNDFPVGNRHPLSFTWVFGVGNYTNSPSWALVDQAAVTRR